jgi:uncharacterized protein YggT (Ycf19 family)
MTYDNKLDIDEEQRALQHEEIRGAIHNEVRSEMLRSGGVPEPETRAEAHELARELRKNAYADVASTETEIHVARGMARISQIVDYVFFLIYGIIGLEILLDLLGAHESSGFKRMIDQLSDPLLAPFRGLLNEPSTGPYRLKLSYIVGLIVYMFIHFAINGLLRMIARRKTEI